MGALRDLARNLFAGLRLALFLPVQRETFRLAAGQLPLLIVFGLALDAVWQFAATGESRSFNIYGVSFACTLYLAFLLVVFLMARVQGRLFFVVPLSIVLLSAGPAIYALKAAGEYLGSLSLLPTWQLWGGLLIVSTIWTVVIAFRSVRLVCRSGAGRAIALAFVYLILLTSVLVGFPNEPMWYDDDFDWDRVVNVWASDDASGEASEDEEDEMAAYRRLDVESAYYAQAELMGDALADLQPQRPGVTDLYFLGFGAFAHEDVFLKEVLSIRSLFDARFDTAGRSLSLINSLETVWDVPLANRHNLAQALDALGRTIDPEEDVVFLYLTSHGSPDHWLAVSFGNFHFRWLSPKRLRRLLDEAGIKWRVVVVSACYSGGFLDVLQDENSLILTASHRDRPSFGCSNDRDYTYFGEAFIRDQLSTEYSFTDAFYLARAAIGLREAREGLRPSMPQIHIGSAIQRKLTELERRFATAGSSARNDDAE